MSTATNQTTTQTDIPIVDDPFTTASNPNGQNPPNQGPANTPKPRYKILSPLNYLGYQPPIEEVIKGVIEVATVTVLFGESGDGKTLSALDCGVCVADPNIDKWLGFDVKSCNVLIIDEETGERHLSRRMGEVMRGHDADIQTPIYSISYARFDFAKNTDYAELTNLINSADIGLVIIDALSDVAPGKNENSTDEMKPILQNLRHIASDTGAAMILIHHANKQGGYRGASTIKGDVDVMIKVEKDKDVITFTSNKIRYGAPVTFSAVANWFNLDPKSFWLTASANVPKSKQVFGKGQKYVLKYLLKNGKSKIDDITQKADTCSMETARKAVYALASISLVERVDSGGRGVIAEYQLSIEGQTEATKL